MSQLTNDEMQRYTRHFSLKEIGITGQNKLKNARVLCIGAGGLANPLLNYVTAAGIGTIGIIDHDKVDVSNLQRQTLFNMSHIGIYKAKAAAEVLSSANPFTKFVVYTEKFAINNALKLVLDYDIVADCTDCPVTKYLINDACFHLKKPLVYAGISQFEGLCSIFCDENNPCYRCIFPELHPTSLIKNCVESGVLGTTAGILGIIQANEIIKHILTIGNTLANKLLRFNTLTLEIDLLNTKRSDDCILCVKKTPFEKIYKEELYKVTTNINSNQISVTELKQLIDSDPIFLLDVRETYEHEIFNIGGINIPLAVLPNYLSQLPKQIQIITYCQAGIRSLSALSILKEAGFVNVKSLAGGINDWRNQ